MEHHTSSRNQNRRWVHYISAINTGFGIFHISNQLIPVLLTLHCERLLKMNKLEIFPTDET